VLVQVPRLKQWHTVVDIASLWTKYCSKDWGDVADDRKSISVLQLRVEKLKATGKLCILLSCLQESENSCLKTVTLFLNFQLDLNMLKRMKLGTIIFGSIWSQIQGKAP